jgi:hypothetical protein
MPSSSKAFVAWVAGIAATVISSVAIYYVLPHGTQSSGSIQIEGRVIDLVQRSLIQGARVTLRAGPYSGSQTTDSLGRYGFEVPLPETTEATLAIEAAGYPAYSVNETLQRLSQVEDDQLLHVAVGSGAGPGAPAGGHVGIPIGALAGHMRPVTQVDKKPPGALTTNFNLAPYVRRPDLVRVGPSR